MSRPFRCCRSSGDSRRHFLARGAALAGGAIAAAWGIPVSRAQIRWTAKQFHNQPEESHQQQFLVQLWDAVRQQTGGRFVCTIHPQNNNIPGSDPAALKMLISGELEFFTVMGGILGQAVPVTEMQGLPFAFRSHQQVHQIMDGEFGDYLRREMKGKGIYGFPFGVLENGFRHISMIDAPVRIADDLAGKKIRVPDGEMFRDFFKMLGAQPVTVNISDLYAALKAHRVDGQENPLVVTEVNKLYEVTKYLSLTNHMWSGFNLIANLKFWNGLPDDVQRIIQRNVVKYVALQRRYTDDWNGRLAAELTRRGMVVNTADGGSFRRRLAPFYERWRKKFSRTAWNLLESQTGKLGI